MHIMSKGLDGRGEGIVWMMSKIKKLGGEIRADYLPEFLDEESKTFLINKLRVYEVLIENTALYSFYWDVFKSFVGNDEMNMTFENFMELRNQKKIHHHEDK